MVDLFEIIYDSTAASDSTEREASYSVVAFFFLCFLVLVAFDRQLGLLKLKKITIILVSLLKIYFGFTCAALHCFFVAVLCAIFIVSFL